MGDQEIHQSRQSNSPYFLCQGMDEIINNYEIMSKALERFRKVIVLILRVPV